MAEKYTWDDKSRILTEEGRRKIEEDISVQNVINFMKSVFIFQIIILAEYGFSLDDVLTFAKWAWEYYIAVAIKDEKIFNFFIKQVEMIYKDYTYPFNNCHIILGDWLPKEEKFDLAVFGSSEKIVDGKVLCEIFPTTYSYPTKDIAREIVREYKEN